MKGLLNPEFLMGASILDSGSIPKGLLGYSALQNANSRNQIMQMQMQQQKAAQERAAKMRQAYGRPGGQVLAGPPNPGQTQAPQTLPTGMYNPQQQQQAMMQMGGLSNNPLAAAQAMMPKPIQPTAAMQNYQHGISNPGFAQHQMAMRRAGATNVGGNTVNMPSDNYANKTMYENLGKNVNSRIEAYKVAGKGATDLQSQLNRFNMAMERAGGTGRWQDTKKVLMQYGASLGFDIDEASLASKESVDMAAKSMIAEQLRMNLGPQTDFDAQFTAEYMPSITSSA